jgi:hypothetical protein
VPAFTRTSLVTNIKEMLFLMCKQIFATEVLNYYILLLMGIKELIMTTLSPKDESPLWKFYGKL